MEQLVLTPIVCTGIVHATAQIAKITTVGLVLLLVAHLVRRLAIDRRMRLPGIAPSWWNPFGAELGIWIYMRTTPRVGEAVLNYITDITNEFSQLSLIRAWIFNVPAVLAYRPESVELLLGSNTNIEKSQFYNLLHPWLGTGLLTSTGAKWRSRRKMLTPAFHFRILEDFLPSINEQAIVMVRKLEALNAERPVDIVKYVTDCTLDIICETAMGQKLNAQSDPNSEYVQAIYMVGESFINRLTRPWLWPEFVFQNTPAGRSFNKSIKVLQDFTKKVIAERREAVKAMLDISKQPRVSTAATNEVGDKATPKAKTTDAAFDVGQKRRKPFLDLLLEKHLENNSVSLEDIREEVDTFMFEGHDTTAMGISWALYLLAENPDCQRKVQQELDDIFSDNTDRHATMEDIVRMKYIEACIKESQRLFPSVPLVARTIREEIAYKKSKIPIGTTAIVSIYSLHRDPASFPDPERFDPDRFLEERTGQRHPYAYVPFSAGPRNCIGQKFALNEEKAVLSWVFRKLWLETKVRRSDLHIVGELVTRSAEGLHVTARPRAQT